MLDTSFGYKMHDELAKMFPEDAVADLESRKLRLGHWRFHPEFPGRDSTKQFWVRWLTIYSPVLFLGATWGVQMTVWCKIHILGGLLPPRCPALFSGGSCPPDPPVG